MNVQDYQKYKAIFENGLGPKARKIMLAGGAVLFVAASPLIITAAAHAAVAAAMLGTGFILTRPRMLRNMDYGVMILSNKATDFMIEQNPLGMIAADISKGESKIEQSKDSIDKIAQQIRKIRDGQAGAKRASLEAAVLARGARGLKPSAAQQRQWRLQSGRAVRLQQSYLNLDEMAQDLEKVLRFFLRMQEISEEKLDGLRIEQEALTFEVGADDAMELAKKELKKVMGHKYEIFERSAKAIKRRSAALLGEMDMMLLSGQNLIAQSDIEHGMMDEEVMKLINGIEAGEVQTDLLKEGDVARLSASTSDPLLELDQVPMQVPARSNAAVGKNKYPMLEIGISGGSAKKTM